MKKIIVSMLLIALLVFTACSAKNTETPTTDSAAPVQTETESPAQTVTEPAATTEPTTPSTGGNKDSLTYQYYDKFIQKKQFTFNQSMSYQIGEQTFNTKSSISRDGENFVMTSIQENGGQTMKYRTLFLDGKVYMIDDTAKTIQQGSAEVAGSPDDFAAVLTQIEQLNLTTGQETVDGVTYATESVTESGITSTYFFEGDILKFYEIGSESGKTRMTVEGYSLEPDKANLEFPVDYQEIVESPIQ